MNNDEQNAAGKDQLCAERRERVYDVHLGKVTAAVLDYDYEVKRRNGYSEMAIVQKREALENVLVPYRPEADKQLLRDAGFTKFDTFFKCYNFSGTIVLK